jgi:hypothetical protein
VKGKNGRSTIKERDSGMLAEETRLERVVIDCCAQARTGEEAAGGDRASEADAEGNGGEAGGGSNQSSRAERNGPQVSYRCLFLCHFC